MTDKSSHTDHENFDVPSLSKSSNAAAAAALLAGGALMSFGISKKGWVGAAAAGGGGYLVYNGLRASSKAYSGRVRVNFTIGKSPEEVYNFVKNAENWPRFVQGLEMQPTAANSLQLSFGKPAGFTVTSDAKITDEKPGEFMAWNSTAGPLQHRGVMRFTRAPGDRGTEISVTLEFKAPAGQVARAVAMFVGWDPEQLVRESLRRLKQLMEAGEIPTVAGQSVGARGLKGAALRVLYRETTRENFDSDRLAGD